MADCPQADHDRLVVLETQFGEYREAMEVRLNKLNELRDMVTDREASYLRNDVYQVSHEDLRKRIDNADEKSQNRHDTLAVEMRQRIEGLSKELTSKIEANYSALDKQIGPVADAQSRLVGIGLAGMGIIGVIGALLGHFWK